MSQEGQRHAEELARLEARKKDLEDALMRLARDEAEAQKSLNWPKRSNSLKTKWRPPELRPNGRIRPLRRRP
ncbi:hypothetical protein [Tritonibacter mobilis]|uniref:hypothetical protein n=1 Tax=Tritonibacter mobilis TaxID=379347 RepID=UPI00089BDADB|nr:hypothetical protein [Tritonibacter mobilis]SDX74741.1 hypothetical protein SAMN05444385_11264 [Tritonibacter mobilis]